MTIPMRVLAWPGMPARDSLTEAASRIGSVIDLDEVWSNEQLEARLAQEPPFDLIFPSDYLVERLTAGDGILALPSGALPLERIAPWAQDAVHDPGCSRSVPFAFGTTGILCKMTTGATPTSWTTLFDPPPGVRVGMLDEVREVVGAALIAAGHSPNETDDGALTSARRLLERQRCRVVRYDSEDFVGPVLAAQVDAHQAWNGPAARAARHHSTLRYAVPYEGATLWITTAAIPRSAPDPDASLRLLAELMDPELAARTTALNGYATPNDPARRLLSQELRDDPSLFPDQQVLKRCHSLRDLGADERRLLAAWKPPGS